MLEVSLECMTFSSENDEMHENDYLLIHLCFLFSFYDFTCI